MSTTTEYKLTDETIAQIAKVLQVAILTGTDIVDNLRMTRFVVEGNKLKVSPGYSEEFNKNLENLLEFTKNQPSQTAAITDA